jgi:hypothetical protein
MTFRKFDHVERLAHSDVSEILHGPVHVFPKIDGTNASVWMHDGELCAGSRTRQLGEGQDNAGFWQWATMTHAQDRLLAALHALDWTDDRHYLYGEWLVPHTFKGYREDAWRRFWIFDVWRERDGCYLSYDEYSPALREAGLDIIDPICVMNNPTEESLQKQVDQNTFLVEDGAGVGEGVVIKRYGWANKHGRQPWAKIVRNEFKEQAKIAFGVPEKDGGFQLEAAIAEEFVTAGRVAKIRAKIRLAIHSELGGGDINEQLALVKEETCRAFEEDNRGRLIPRLLQTVYDDVLEEELRGVIKKRKDPTIDFKKLRAHCLRFTKLMAQDLF